MGKLPEDIEIEYINNNQVEANIYEVTAIFINNNPNYNDIEPLKATLTINKKDLSATTYLQDSVIKVKLENKNGFLSTEKLEIKSIDTSMFEEKILVGFKIILLTSLIFARAATVFFMLF